MRSFSGLQVFDLDKTLIKNNSSFHFYFFLYSIQFYNVFSILLTIIYYIRYRFLGMSLIKLHQKVFHRFLKGRSGELLSLHADAFLERHLEKMLYQPAVKELKSAQKRGHYVLIISSSPSFLVAPIAKKLNVHEWKATEYDVDKEKNLCNILSLILGYKKAEITIDAARRLELKRDVITAYSDSIEDLPLLKVAGKAIGVNPDRKLKNYCKKKGWDII